MINPKWNAPWSHNNWYIWWVLQVSHSLFMFVLELCLSARECLEAHPGFGQGKCSVYSGGSHKCKYILKQRVQYILHPSNNRYTFSHRQTCSRKQHFSYRIRNYFNLNNVEQLESVKQLAPLFSCFTLVLNSYLIV